MNEKKLRPEQRKLFRRIFLTAFDTGATVEEATAMADRSVAEWEARGAFEADAQEPPSPSPNLVTPHYHLRLRFSFHETGTRPVPGDIIICATGTVEGSGVVVSYRIHMANQIDVHAIVTGGNPNVGATWLFKTPLPGISANGEVIGESSHTHEPLPASAQ